MLTDLEQSMNIYTKLRSVNPFYPGDIARLLQTLHTSVRIARRDANKYKSQKKDNSDAIEKIKEYFLIIAEDMRNGVVQASFWGVIHLYTAFATRGFESLECSQRLQKLQVLQAHVVTRYYRFCY